MEAFEIVEFVRKQKGISIVEICGSEVSRSVYERFAKNSADTTISKFTYFLQQLNLDFDELKVFDYPAERSRVSHMMREMIHAFMNQDVAELQRIIKFCQKKEKPVSKREEHLISLCELFIARLLNQKVDISTSRVYQYLVNAQTWTHYELVLFNNCMYAFNLEFIEVVLEKSIAKLSLYRSSKEGKSESFRMLANAIVHFIQNQHLTLAWKYVEKLSEFHLEQDMYYERNLKLLLQGVWETIRGNQRGAEKVKQALKVCDYLQSKENYKMNLDLLCFIQEIYDVDFSLAEINDSFEV